MTEALALDDVTLTYPGTPPVEALRGVTLSIASGELVAIVGASGSGKSTLLHVMGTLERPTSGVVRIGGHQVSHLSDRRLSGVRAHLVGFVFQQFFLLPGMSTVDNVATGLLYQGVAEADRRNAAAEALVRVGLGHRLGHHPNQLSGGERQRVAVARGLVHRPGILLADEPTGNLDSRSSSSILTLLHELHDDGVTIVVITHEREIAGSFPREVQLSDGAILRDRRTGSVVELGVPS